MQLQKLLLSLIITSSALYAMESEHKKEAQTEEVKKERVAAIAHHIESYKKERDHASLTAMLAGNKELLLPGDNVEDQVLKTTKFFGSKNYTTKVFVKGDRPIGFITYQKEVSSNWFLKWIVGSPGAIQLFNVLEEHRRQGIGAALLNDALADMKRNDFDAVILQTKVANTSARALYEKHGFALGVPVAPGISDCFYRCKLVNSKL